MDSPWEKFPKIWPSSKQWKIGPAADYLQEWLAYYKTLNSEEQSAYRKDHKAPFYWFEIYLLQNENLISWVMPVLFFSLLCSPIRFINFKLKN